MYQTFVSKPIFGREGAGIYIGSNYTTANAFRWQVETAFDYKPEAGSSIYQKFEKMPVMQGRMI